MLESHTSYTYNYQMTRPDLNPESAQILTTKTEELNDKLSDLTGKVTTTLERRLKAFEVLHTREGLSADPERLGAIAAKLFESVDTLIFLAEDYQSLAKRIQESKAVAAVDAEGDDYYSKEELELFGILQASDTTAITAATILAQGFSTAASLDLTTRKKLLQKTLKSLHEKLSRTEPPMEIIKSGQTRGTKYQLAMANVALAPATETAAIEEQPIPATTEEITEVAAEVPTAAIQPLAHREERVVTNEHEAAITSAIQTLIDSDLERPIICIGDISMEAFGSGRIDERLYAMAKEIIRQDARITEIGKGEYRINGREDTGAWIDKASISERVYDFFTLMGERGSTSESYAFLIRTVGRHRRFLTSVERNAMMHAVKNHPAFASFDGRNVTINPSVSKFDASAATVSEPQERPTRGLTRSEINSRITELGLGTKQPYHRYKSKKRR